MSGLLALHAAHAAGVYIMVDGDDLVLEAPSRPSPLVMAAVSRHKPAIADLLRAPGYHGHPHSLGGQRTRCFPSDWAEALAALALTNPPAGFSSKEWDNLIEDANDFIESWADQAVELGWDVLDLFGVHLRSPAVRYDGMGLVPLIRGGKIVALTADRATIRMPSGSELTVLRRPLQDVVPIWKAAGLQREVT